MVENCLGKVTKLVFERNSLTYSRKAIHASNSLFQKSINSNEILGAAATARQEEKSHAFQICGVGVLCGDGSIVMGDGIPYHVKTDS